MRKFGIFVGILGLILLIAGGAMVALAYKDGAFKKDVTTKEINIEESFDNIYADLDISNLNFEIAEDNKCKIVCQEYKDFEHTAKVEDNKLILKNIDNRKWYNKWFFNVFTDIKLTVYLPKTDFNEFDINLSVGNLELQKIINVDNIKVKSSTGNIRISNVTSTNINVKASVANILISEVNVENIECEASTGNVSLVNVLATGKMVAHTSTGNIKFDSSDAANIEATASTGNISGNLLTPKSFNATSSTGKINVPTTTGEPCILRTSTGNINITIKE